MNKTYFVENTQVSVSWQKIFPNGKEPLPDKVAIFFPGYPVKAPVETLQKIGENIADSSGMTTYVVYTNSKHALPNPVHREAQAICKFLVEQEIRCLTLVGFSQGGIKAINTIVFIQEMKLNISVEGLILVNSVGLNEIGIWKAVRREFIDFLIKSFLAILKEGASKTTLRKKLNFIAKKSSFGLLATRDFLLSFWREAKSSPRNFFRTFYNAINESSKKSPYLNKVEVPVILIQGARDRAFNNQRIVTRARTQIAEVQLLTDITKNSHKISKETKEQIFAENLFPRSPYVKLVIAEKFGMHYLLIFRPNEIARASFYLLQRYQRGISFDV